ncbi:sensor histidine kinase [Cytophaga aurantiaca]|uniref:sensor histidine kinase n=1 Tax=Cytophaga aurantiaca TaxID=29530 RepID=UPI00038041F1|nr:sensor histidine kinase [Cytophaga aurantiaca]
MKRTVLIFLFIVARIFVHGQSSPLVLEDTTQRFDWSKGYYSIYYDSLNKRSFGEIVEISNKGMFTQTLSDAPRLQSFNKEMWAKIDVQNKGTTTKKYLIELYDFHIDLYDVFVFKNDTLRYHFSGGDFFIFDYRKVQHKNFINEVNFDPNSNYTIFVRIQSKQSVTAFGTIRTPENLVYYSNKEYTLLSIFYGFLLLMALYCFIVYVVTLERTYLYFTINVISVALYSLSNDGLGYQYLWGNHIVLNEYVQSFSIALFSATALLYSASFLQVSRICKKSILAIRLLVCLRIGMFIFGLYFYEPLLYMYHFDILILIFIFYIGIYVYYKQFIAARFFILAYNALFIGFTLHFLMVLGLIDNSLFTVYALNFGTIFQLFLFSFALADQVRLVNREIRITQLNLINQLKENDALKDKVTQELEGKVQERTKELEYKNQQLDAFVYKASHDIKGPLKSIIGLAKLGLLDVEDESAREYFSHIEKSSERLDKLVADLLQVSKIKSSFVKKTQIDFEEIIEEIKYSLNNLPDFDAFQIDLNIIQDGDFYSDRNMIYSIFQNLIENAFIYRDVYKEICTLNIRIEIDKQKSVFEFSDNGIGINKDIKDKVFDMFFRASDISGGSGLGLYLVKMAVNKIGGRIDIESKVKKGTTFTIVI